MAGIGHNSGQVIEPGQSWRRFAWAKARTALLPTLPIEVVRLRVKRAAELGLPYRTYAGVRASTGHDLIGFLFSSNALRVVKGGAEMPRDRRDRLAALIASDRVGLMHKSVQVHPDLLDATYPGPPPLATWSATRDHLRAVMRQHGKPADRYLLVGDTALERDWAEAMQAAGYLTADSYFGATAL